jgi:hypothetical protein
MSLTTGRTLERADACGLTGAPALTMGARFFCLDSAGYPQYCRVGAAGMAGIDSKWFCLLCNGATANDVYITTYTHGPNFTVPQRVDRSNYYVARAAAGAPNSTYRLRFNGADIGVESVGGNGALPMALSNQVTGIGGGAGPGASVVRDAPGDLNCLMLFNADLSGTDLTALETELAAHR